MAAHECGLQSAMAAPIKHDGVCFGVLAVYDRERDTVTQRTTDLLSEYADAIGYALQAAEWRRTLLSSTNTTVEITIESGSSALQAFSRALPRAATVETTTVLPRNDTEVFYLASISGASVGEIKDAGACATSICSVDVFGAGDSVQCGLIVETPVPETILVEAGGRFRRTVVEDGRVSISAVSRADGSVRSVVGALEDVFGGVSVTTVWSDSTGQPNIDHRGLERLTERQRQVLELAVDAGYFERPRRHNTSELAAMLDISRATVTQHLRAAQSKLFDDLLPD
ncbi:helix-turn-helix domain-containing protein [Natronorubrum halophilum]|uniref:helix-turn-helix domain-containing protein n=1 Tax=Natronorubrum halophilum TaxID=1702106 RepID=UPI0010C21DC2|nr:helix-turn-helix domain-containing protein [Natronorubrum halophilum]